MTTPTMELLTWAEAHGVSTMIGDALAVARQAHRGERRRSGDPYITHPVAVALVLAEHGAAPETVTAAVLHDVLDARSPLSLAALRARFGDIVADLIADVARLDHDPAGTGAWHVDRRALQVKVADRLHNMRTIHHLAPTSQRLKAEQTRDVVAPVAVSLGLVEVGLELERLAAETLRAVEAATDSRGRRRRTQVASPSTGILRRSLHVGALALPQHCRDRWRQDWEGELHACATLRERAAFTRNVLLGLPAMARHTRRTDRR